MLLDEVLVDAEEAAVPRRPSIVPGLIAPGKMDDPRLQLICNSKFGIKGGEVIHR